MTLYEQPTSDNGVYKNLFGDIEYYYDLPTDSNSTTPEPTASKDMRKLVVDTVADYCKANNVKFQIYDSSGITTKEPKHENKTVKIPKHTRDEGDDDDDDEDDEDIKTAKKKSLEEIKDREKPTDDNKQPNNNSTKKPTDEQQPNATKYKLSLHIYTDIMCKTFVGVENMLGLIAGGKFKFDTKIYETKKRLFRTPFSRHEHDHSRILLPVSSNIPSTDDDIANIPLIQTGISVPQTVNVQKFMDKLKSQLPQPDENGNIPSTTMNTTVINILDLGMQ